jgi:hypothetical protein
MVFNFRKFLLAAAGINVLAVGTASARAAEIVFPAFQDATLLGGTDATTNQSLADPGLFVGTDGQDNPKRSLIEFNIQQSVQGQTIPVGATITSVQLTMTVGQVAGSGGGSSGGSGTAETISLFDESQAWGQPTNVAGATSFGGTGHGGSPKTGDATWNYAMYTSSPWGIAGGDWTSTLTTVASASVTGQTISFTWASTPAMVADVQNWLDDPSVNFGWIIKNADETDATDFRAFWSAQGAAAASNSFAPALTVDFVVPEPASVAMLALGAPALLRRRKRSRQLQ